MSGKLVFEDIETVFSRREAGETITSIARSYDVSQGMIRAVLDGWLPKTRAQISELRERQHAGQERGLKAWPRTPYDPVARRARSLLTRAISSGKLVRQPCHCGATMVEGHHHNGYGSGHELDVVWLCGKHHKEAHNEQRAVARSGKEGTTTPVTLIHAACDRRIAELEAELRRLRGGASTSTVDTSTGIVQIAVDQLTMVQVEQAHGTRPAFLAAPDDDCGLCGHGWHGDGTLNRVCGACGCDHYIAASEPLF